MAVVEMLERCAGCPFAGLCTPCRPQTEFGKVLTVNSIKEVPAKFKGIITFNPVSQGSGEPPTIRTSERICHICKEDTSTCPHSKASKKVIL